MTLRTGWAADHSTGPMTVASVRRGCVCVLVLASACSVSDGVLGRVWGRGDGGFNADGSPVVRDSSLVVADSPFVADASIAVGDGSLAILDSALVVDGGDDVAETGVIRPICPSSPVVSISKNSTCVNRLAASTFTNALCTCADLKLGDYLSTHAFNSTIKPYRPMAYEDGGAAVGVDGNYSGRSTGISVRGSFAVAGFGALQIAGNLEVSGDLYAAGNVSVTGSTDVWRDAWLGGTFSGLGPFTVGANLHHAGTVEAQPLSAETTMREAVSVARPCPCGLFDIVDIPSLVDAARTTNDNSGYGIDQKAFARISGANEWTVSCGQVFLSQIGGTGSLVVHVTGSAALFIDGSINLTGDLSFDVAPGAEIDVFVKGDLALQGALALASKARPAAGRIWVWGLLPITLASPWVGNLYAPHASVRVTGGLEAWGSIFAFDLSGSTYADVVFDRAILQPTGCTAPDPPAGLCTRCNWCNNGAACVDGACGKCQSDADCCSLSVCTSNGTCAPLIAPASS